MQIYNTHLKNITPTNKPLFHGATCGNSVVDSNLMEFSHLEMRGKKFHIIYAGDSQKVKNFNKTNNFLPMELKNLVQRETKPDNLNNQGLMIKNQIGKLYGESMKFVKFLDNNLTNNQFIAFDFMVNCPVQIYLNGLVINDQFYSEDDGIIFVMKHKYENSIKIRRFESIKLIDNNYKLVVSRFGEGLSSPKFNDIDHDASSIIGVMTGIYSE